MHCIILNISTVRSVQNSITVALIIETSTAISKLFFPLVTLQLDYFLLGWPFVSSGIAWLSNQEQASIRLLTSTMVPTSPLKATESWDSCYAFNPGTAFQKLATCFANLWSWFIFSVARDKKLSLISLTLEKPAQPQGKARRVCAIVLYFTIAKPL